MKLLGSTKNKIPNYEKGENVSHLEITEVTLIHCDIVNNDNYQQDSRVLYIFVLDKSFGQLPDISQKIFYSSKLLTQNFNILKYCLRIKISNHVR